MQDYARNYAVVCRYVLSRPCERLSIDFFRAFRCFNGFLRDVCSAIPFRHPFYLSDQLRIAFEAYGNHLSDWRRLYMTVFNTPVLVDNKDYTPIAILPARISTLR